MANIVWIIGALVAIWGIVAVIMPGRMKACIQFVWQKRLAYGVVAVKIIGGVIFLIFARECNIPWLILTIGLLSAGGSILFCFLPFKKIQAYLQWWIKRPLWLYRIWGILAAAFGGLLMYAGVPRASQQAVSFLFSSFLA